MDHKDIQKLIPDFLNDDLENRELAGFLDHIDNCPECREELTIQFLVRVGMQRLEDGNTFNLKKELDILLSDAKKKLKARHLLVMTSVFLQLAVVLFSVICVVLAVFL